jgi:hypothetical protein
MYSGTPGLRGISGKDLRRAVTRVLLYAGGPLSIGEVIDRLAADGVEVSGRWPGSDMHHRISGLLTQQVKRGRFRRISHGRYVVVPEQISRTDRWRIDNWERFNR